MILEELKEKYFEKDRDEARESIVIAMRADPDFTEEIELDEGGRKTLIQAQNRLIDDYIDAYHPTRAHVTIVLETHLQKKVSKNWEKLCEYADLRAKTYQQEELMVEQIEAMMRPELFLKWLDHMMLCPQDSLETTDLIRQFQSALLGDEETFNNLFDEKQRQEALKDGYYAIGEFYFSPL